MAAPTSSPLMRVQTNIPDKNGSVLKTEPFFIAKSD
jgi:hypothetical protein